MATWYQQGIAARKAGTPRHENPYNRSPSFWERFMEYDNGRANRDKKRDWWFQGWDQQNEYMRDEEKQAAARWNTLMLGFDSIMIRIQTEPDGLTKPTLVKAVDGYRGLV